MDIVCRIPSVVQLVANFRDLASEAPPFPKVPDSDGQLLNAGTDALSEDEVRVAQLDPVVASALKPIPQLPAPVLGAGLLIGILAEQSIAPTT
ncbi:MAG TPA: hypothetical protein VGS21_06810 [Acidimicrobiales bacterium]|nr:hypothetical protein [Acidimicrobiales bacterium]